MMRSFCGIGWNVRNATKNEIQILKDEILKLIKKINRCLEMETGNNGQFLHRQLLGRFLITETT